MKVIVAVDKNWGIGKDDQLLVSIPEDMKFFRETTTGHVVVMGRKTLESFPGQKPLKNRTNLVLTANPSYEKPGAVILHSVEELKEELKKHDPDEVYLIGGGSMYKMLLPLCDTAYVTKIDRIFDADTHFPNLDEDGEWAIAYQSDRKEYQGLPFRFMTYVRV